MDDYPSFAFALTFVAAHRRKLDPNDRRTVNAAQVRFSLRGWVDYKMQENIYVLWNDLLLQGVTP